MLEVQGRTSDNLDELNSDGVNVLSGIKSLGRTLFHSLQWAGGGADTDNGAHDSSSLLSGQVMKHASPSLQIQLSAMAVETKCVFLWGTVKFSATDASQVDGDGDIAN
jgi:hypothetical protein